MKGLKRITCWSGEDGKFIAEVSELPGCMTMTDGDTPEAALQNSEVITAEWLETADILEREVSQPRGKLTYA